MHQFSSNRILSDYCEASSLILSSSQNWDAVEVALDRAFVEGVHIRGWSKRCSIGRVYSPESAHFIRGMKSACGNGREVFVGFQWNQIRTYQHRAAIQRPANVTEAVADLDGSSAVQRESLN